MALMVLYYSMGTSYFSGSGGSITGSLESSSYGIPSNPSAYRVTSWNASLTGTQWYLSASGTFDAYSSGVGISFASGGSSTTQLTTSGTTMSNAILNGASSATIYVNRPSGSTGSGNIALLKDSRLSIAVNYELNTSSVTAPTSVTIANSVVDKGGTTTLSWSGASAGTGNPIDGYVIQYSDDGGAWTTFVSGITSSWSSYTVPASSVQNVTRRYRVGTMNTISSYSTAYSTAYGTVRSKVDVGAIIYSTPSADTRIALNPGSGGTITWAAATNANRYYYTIYDSSGNVVQAETYQTGVTYVIPASFFNAAGRTLYLRVRGYNTTDGVTGVSTDSKRYVTNTPPVMNASNTLTTVTIAGTSITAVNDSFSIPKSTDTRTLTASWAAATDVNGDSISYNWNLLLNDSIIASGTSSTTSLSYDGTFNTVGDRITVVVTPIDAYNSGITKTFISAIIVSEVVNSVAASLVSTDTSIVSTFYQTFSIKANADVKPTSFTFRYSTNGGTNYTNFAIVNATSNEMTYIVPASATNSLLQGQTLWIQVIATAYNSVQSSTFIVYKYRAPEILSYVVPSQGSIGTTGEVLNRGIGIDSSDPTNLGCYKDINASINITWPEEDISTNRTSVSDFLSYNVIYYYMYNSITYEVGSQTFSKNTASIDTINKSWFLDWDDTASRFNNLIISGVTLRAVIQAYYTPTSYITITKDSGSFVLNFKSPPIFITQPTAGQVTTSPDDTFLYSGQNIQIQNNPLAVDTNRTLAGNNSINYYLRISPNGGTSYDIPNSNGFLMPGSLDEYSMKDFTIALVATDDLDLNSAISNTFLIYDTSGTVQKSYIGYRAIPALEIYNKSRDSSGTTYYVRITDTGSNLQLSDSDTLWDTFNNIASIDITYYVRTTPDGIPITVDISKTPITKTTVASGLIGQTPDGGIIISSETDPGVYKVFVTRDAVDNGSTYLQITFNNGFYTYISIISYVAGTEAVFAIDKKGGTRVMTSLLRDKVSMSTRDQGGEAIFDFYDEDNATLIGSIIKDNNSAYGTYIRFKGFADHADHAILSDEATHAEAADTLTAILPITLGGTNADTREGAWDSIVALGGTLSGNLSIKKDTPYLNMTASNNSLQAIQFGMNGTDNSQWRLLSNTDNNFYLQNFQGTPSNTLWVTGDTKILNLLNPLPISSGGTAANTAVTALTNLGAVGKAGGIDSQMTGTLFNNAAAAFQLNYGGANAAVLYYDATNFYILFSDTSTGIINSLRPLYVARTTGLVTIGNGLGVAGSLTGAANIALTGQRTAIGTPTLLYGPSGALSVGQSFTFANIAYYSAILVIFSNGYSCICGKNPYNNWFLGSTAENAGVMVYNNYYAVFTISGTTVTVYRSEVNSAADGGIYNLTIRAIFAIA